MSARMNSDEINARLREWDQAGVDPRLCYGWWWRDVNFDAEMHWLSYQPAKAPEWFAHTAEARFIGKRWKPEGVRFDESQKWGYPRVRVDGVRWVRLRELCATADTPQEVFDFMQTLHPDRNTEPETADV